MKPSHYTTPRSMYDAQWHCYGEAIETSASGTKAHAADLIMAVLAVLCIIGAVFGVFA